MLINKKAIKQLALEESLVRFPNGKFTRVSGEFFLHIEGHLKDYVRQYIQQLPSVGKTIK